MAEEAAQEVARLYGDASSPYLRLPDGTMLTPGELYVEPGSLYVKWRPREGQPIPEFLLGVPDPEQEG